MKYLDEEKELAVLARYRSALKELAQGQKIKVITKSNVHRFLRKGTLEGTKATNARWGRWEDILLDPDPDIGPVQQMKKRQQQERKQKSHTNGLHSRMARRRETIWTRMRVKWRKICSRPSEVRDQECFPLVKLASRIMDTDGVLGDPGAHTAVGYSEDLPPPHVTVCSSRSVGEPKMGEPWDIKEDGLLVTTNKRLKVGHTAFCRALINRAGGEYLGARDFARQGRLAVGGLPYHRVIHVPVEGCE